MPRTSLPPSLFDLAGLSSRGDRETLALSWRETFTAGDAREAAASQYEALGSQTKVAVQLSDPVEFVRTLVRLDGKVSALLLLAPALPRETVDVLMKSSGASVLLDDESRPPLHRFNLEDSTRVETHWLMTTSGTTGTPKVVEHHLSSLARTVKSTRGAGEVPHWGMLYDPSRFAGLQVVLQSLIGGGRLLIPNPEGPLSDRIAVLTANACTHLSATPSLWRKLLMLPSSADLPLRQITIGGEIAESRLLQALTHKFPAARITHIYASTEVGVGFAVNDRQAGFPLEFVSAGTGAVDLRIRDGLLWARPPKGLCLYQRPCDHRGRPRIFPGTRVFRSKCRRDQDTAGGGGTHYLRTPRGFRLRCSAPSQSNPGHGDSRFDRSTRPKWRHRYPQERGSHLV